MITEKQRNDIEDLPLKSREEVAIFERPSMSTSEKLIDKLQFLIDKINVEKDGQIIVDELRPMSDAPTDGAFIVVDSNYKRAIAMINSRNNLRMLMYLDVDFGQAHLGYMPLPIYQPNKPCE
tara:strand:- start:578 stop:943 length:366 start_codon:yes stop_codon:yes gene_type:complete